MRPDPPADRHRCEAVMNMGGKPSKGTKADKRIKGNKGK